MSATDDLDELEPSERRTDPAPPPAPDDDFGLVTLGDLKIAMATLNKRFDALEGMSPGKALHDLTNFIAGIPETIETLRMAANEVLRAHAEQKVIADQQIATAARLELLERRHMNGGPVVAADDEGEPS